MENVQVYAPHFALSISHATTEPHDLAHLPAFQTAFATAHSIAPPGTRTTELATLGIF